MKKLFLSLVAAIVAATATFAQKDRVATLTHEGSVRTFYGTNALTEAHEAAVDGDVITLSSGIFFIETISKGITIVGAGMQDDEERNVEKTLILGISNSGYECQIMTKISKKAAHPLSIKNVQISDDRYYRLQLDSALCDATFTKCYIVGGIKEENAVCKNVTFVQCRFDQIEHEQDSEANYLNCYIGDINSNYIKEEASVSFLNCTIEGGSGLSSYNNATFLNCVLHMNGDYWGNTINTSNTVENCLGFHPNKDKGVWDNGKNCKLTHTNMFKEGTFYELTDEAKALITSNDGTEIGMYGGQYPYNPIPDGPRITKFNVATKSSADNKLSVDVEVSSAE